MLCCDFGLASTMIYTEEQTKSRRPELLSKGYHHHGDGRPLQLALDRHPFEWPAFTRWSYLFNCLYSFWTSSSMQLVLSSTLTIRHFLWSTCQFYEGNQKRPLSRLQDTLIVIAIIVLAITFSSTFVFQAGLITILLKVLRKKHQLFLLRNLRGPSSFLFSICWLLLCFITLT